MTLDNKGYSLLELLLVLIIVAVISSFALIMNNRYVEKHTFDLFYNQLILDSRHLQLTAMKEGKNITLLFDSGGTRYVGRKSFFESLFDRELPPGYRLSKRSNLQELSFHPNGTIEKFGTLIFETPSGIKIIHVYIGKGRMTLEQ